MNWLGFGMSYKSDEPIFIVYVYVQQQTKSHGLQIDTHMSNMSLF